MIYTIWALPPVIPVGIQTESGVEEIGFDVSSWLTRWPDMNISVWPTRPGEEASYPAADVKLVGNILYWYPNSTDTEKEGAGTVEIVGIGGGKRKSSGVVDTLVKKTSLDVTQETPDPIKPWAEKVLQAAQEVKADVDVGEGGLFLVRQYVKDGKTTSDRTQSEVRNAISEGKTCLCITTSGKVHTYAGEKDYPYAENEKSCPMFTRYYHDGKGMNMDAVYILSDGTPASTGEMMIRTPNPMRLKFTGAVEAEYNGSSYVVVNIPEGVDEENVNNLVEAKLNALLNPVILPETTVEIVDGQGVILTPLSDVPKVGKTYSVNYNGTTYDCQALHFEDDGMVGVVMGNTDALGEPGGNTDAPFIVVLIPDGMETADGVMAYGQMLDMSGATSVTISVNETTSNAASGSKTLTVTADVDMNNGAQISNVSHTVAQIIAAAEADKTVRMVMSANGGKYILPLTAYSANEGMAIFYARTILEQAWQVTGNADGFTVALSA